MRSSLKTTWIAIALLAVLFTVMTVQACTPVPVLKATTAGGFYGGSAGGLPQTIQIQIESCTGEAMDASEYSCMMPGGVLDLNYLRKGSSFRALCHRGRGPPFFPHHVFPRNSD